MQITKVSFMNFNGVKNTASKELKKTASAMAEKNSFFPETALTGKIETEAGDTYIKQYAESRRVMQEMKAPKDSDVAENYFGPFLPISNKNIK